MGFLTIFRDESLRPGRVPRSDGGGLVDHAYSDVHPTSPALSDFREGRDSSDKDAQTIAHADQTFVFHFWTVWMKEQEGCDQKKTAYYRLENNLSITIRYYGEDRCAIC
jgi:hypothetical protein